MHQLTVMNKIIEPSFLNFLWLRGAQCCQQLSDQGMSRSLLCHGSDSSRKQPHQVLLSPSEAAQMQLGIMHGQGLCLSPFYLRKKWPLRCYFPLFFLLTFLLERQKKVNQLQWFQQSFKHTVGSNAGFQMPGLFRHYSTSWTAEKGNSNSNF